VSDNNDKRSEKNRRSGGPLPVATLVSKLTRKALGKYGFSYGGLITEWETIVGHDLAQSCTPEKLTFPSNKRDSGVLRLRADGGAALELQHLEPQILERINSYFGYRAVSRLQLVNGPVRRNANEPSPKPRTQAAPTFNPCKVSDPKLRDVLERLGKSMQRRESNGKNG
jgi:hypothetical protein